MDTSVFNSGQPTVTYGGAAPSLSLSSASDVVNKILCPTFSLMFWILMAVSMIMVLMAGFQYATAGDDTEKTTKGRKTLTWAAVGIVVALSAKAFPVLVASIYGVTGVLQCAAF